MEERGEFPKLAQTGKKPGVRIAGHSETSTLGHPGRFEYSARQSELRFLSGTNSSLSLSSTFQFASKKSTWHSRAANSFPESDKIMVLWTRRYPFTSAVVRTMTYDRSEWLA